MSAFFSSLRVRLRFLVLLAVVPAFGLILHTGGEQRKLAADAAKEKVLKVARDAVQEQRSLLREARHLLSLLAQQPEVGNRATCSAFLGGQLKLHHEYSNLGVIDLDGYLRCSAVPIEKPIYAGDRLYFRRATETQDFAVGEYQIGRMTGRASVNLGYPILDGRGKLSGVLFGPLDLEWLDQILARSQLPTASILFAIDQNGTFFARYPDGEKWVGKTAPYSALLQSVLDKQSSGTFEALDADGLSRLYAFEALTVSGTGSVYVGVGFPLEVAYAEVNHTLARNLILLGLVSLLAVVAAWFGGDLFILREVKRLIGATERLASGDLTARVGRTYGKSELSKLASAFDQMAESLEKQRRDIRENLDRIRALHEIDLAISSTLDLRSILEILLEKVDRFFPFATTSSIRLRDKKTSDLQIVAFRNLSEAAWKEENHLAGHNLAESILATKAPLAIREIQLDWRTQGPDFFCKQELFSFLGVPLSGKDKVLGVLSLYTREERDFSQQDVEFLVMLGGQAAIAIQNSQLYEETKRQAEELRKKTEELEKANKVKDEFLNVMSHELRTPLTAVMGYVGLIKDRVLGEINAQQEKAIDNVLSRVRDQVSMVNSILYASSLEAQAVNLERQEFSLSNFLQRLRSVYTFPLDKEVALTWDYPADLPVMKTDSGKLKLVLQNLIDNGIKFTETGHVNLSLRLTGTKGQVQSVQFKVSDTGIGMAKKNLPLIFDKFYQIDSSATRLYEGAGLGLFIVKRFTEMLGGTVEVDSEPGKGSTFNVTIPCEPVEQIKSVFEERSFPAARQIRQEKAHPFGREQ